MQSNAYIIAATMLGYLLVYGSSGDTSRLSLLETYVTLLLGAFGCLAMTMAFRLMRTRGKFSALMLVVTALLACSGLFFDQIHSQNVGLIGAAFTFCCSLGYATVFRDGDDLVTNRRMKVLTELLQVELVLVIFYTFIFASNYRWSLFCHLRMMFYFCLWQLVGTMTFHKSARSWKADDSYLPCVLYVVIFVFPFLAFCFLASSISTIH
ncbi:MAG: hypothetical protein H6677_12810 [Candidatus Obscuribacterales bacterium]|nr:hypothetical protein [Cyanobacteria bacterium HKST-UBA01]MCB9469147.1 hypothetical protein [Candidatus Obscuribacterales bacterium]